MTPLLTSCKGFLSANHTISNIRNIQNIDAGQVSAKPRFFTRITMLLQTIFFSGNFIPQLKTLSNQTILPLCLTTLASYVITKAEVEGILSIDPAITTNIISFLNIASIVAAVLASTAFAVGFTIMVVYHTVSVYNPSLIPQAVKEKFGYITNILGIITHPSLLFKLFNSVTLYFYHQSQKTEITSQAPQIANQTQSTTQILPPETTSPQLPDHFTIDNFEVNRTHVNMHPLGEIQILSDDEIETLFSSLEEKFNVTLTEEYYNDKILDKLIDDDRTRTKYLPQHSNSNNAEIKEAMQKQGNKDMLSYEWFRKTFIPDTLKELQDQILGQTEIKSQTYDLVQLRSEIQFILTKLNDIPTEPVDQQEKFLDTFCKFTIRASGYCGSGKDIAVTDALSSLTNIDLKTKILNHLGSIRFLRTIGFLKAIEEQHGLQNISDEETIHDFYARLAVAPQFVGFLSSKSDLELSQTALIQQKGRLALLNKVVKVALLYKVVKQDPLSLYSDTLFKGTINLGLPQINYVNDPIPISQFIGFLSLKVIPVVNSFQALMSSIDKNLDINFKKAKEAMKELLTIMFTSLENTIFYILIKISDILSISPLKNLLEVYTTHVRGKIYANKQPMSFKNITWEDKMFDKKLSVSDPYKYDSTQNIIERLKQDCLQITTQEIEKWYNDNCPELEDHNIEETFSFQEKLLIKSEGIHPTVTDEGYAYMLWKMGILDYKPQSDIS